MTERHGTWRFLDANPLHITIGNASGEARIVRAPFDWLTREERARLSLISRTCQRDDDFSSAGRRP